MEKDAVISISGTQTFLGDEPETIELITQGRYRYEPGRAEFSYTETQMTGMEGVFTDFTIEDEKTVTLRRSGKISSEMVFERGVWHDSLYDTGIGGALLLSVCARNVTVLLNEHGGVFDLEYDIRIERTTCGTHSYHIVIREA